MPMDYRLYPRNWRAIALRRKQQAGWRCKMCGRRHGEWTLNRFGNLIIVQVGVAHVNHDPWNPRAKLIVLCRQCHLRYDAKQRRRKRRMMQVARGQLVFWKEALR